MARRRGRKSKGGRSKWGFSITSIFLLLYSINRFGIIQIIKDLMATSGQAGSFTTAVNTFITNFNMTAIIDVLFTSIQVKLLATIAKAVSGPTIAKVWKLNLRW